MRVNHLLASTALSTSALFAAGSALAQPMTYSWTGWYAGLNVGGSWTSIDQNVTVPGFFAFPSSGRSSGFTGGFQTGYNWHFAPNWVAGLEGEINYLSGKKSNSFTVIAFAGGNGPEDVVGTQQSKVRWLSTIRARFGHTWNRTFVYAMGGLALGGVSSSVNARSTENDLTPGDSASFVGSHSSTRAGWTAGGGIEHAFTDRWSGKLEYLHYDLGSISYNVLGVITSGNGNGLPLTWPATASFRGDIVRVGVNYKISP